MFNTPITIYVQIQYLHVRKIWSEESESMATTGAWCSGRLLSSTTLSYGGSTVGENNTNIIIDILKNKMKPLFTFTYLRQLQHKLYNFYKAILLAPMFVFLCTLCERKIEYL